jgi:hypothetical protein
LLAAPLIAETSCEARTLFLDQSLLIKTMAAQGAAIFSPSFQSAASNPGVDRTGFIAPPATPRPGALAEGTRTKLIEREKVAAPTVGAASTHAPNGALK